GGSPPLRRGAAPRVLQPRALHLRPGPGRRAHRPPRLSRVHRRAGREHRPQAGHPLLLAAGSIRRRVRPHDVGVPAPAHHPVPRPVRAGNAVAPTTTVNYGFGSCLVARGTGIILNDEMDDFSTQPGVPNVYGLVYGENNAVAPGKIPVSSMAPTLVFQKDRPDRVLLAA